MEAAGGLLCILTAILWFAVFFVIADTPRRRKKAAR